MNDLELKQTKNAPIIFSLTCRKNDRCVFVFSSDTHKKRFPLCVCVYILELYRDKCNNTINDSQVSDWLSKFSFCPHSASHHVHQCRSLPAPHMLISASVAEVQGSNRARGRNWTTNRSASEISRRSVAS